MTIPGQALKLYNVSDHWQEYASMISDIRTICPLQELASYVNSKFTADVYSYVATQKRSSGPLEGKINPKISKKKQSNLTLLFQALLIQPLISQPFWALIKLKLRMKRHL